MNRLLKKHMVIFLAVVLLVSGIIAASAEEVPTFTVSDATGAPGEEKIDCSGVTDITMWRIALTYDTNVLEYVKDDLNGVFSGTTSGDPQNVPYVISWVNAIENVHSNGKMAEVTFKIKNSAAKGDYPITLEYNEKEVVKLNDTDKTQFDQVHFEIKNGKVSVIEKVESKPESKVESKIESKPESKPESKIESKPESKVESKIESKPESKAESKIESKPESKTESKKESSAVTSNKTTSTIGTVSGASSNKTTSGNDTTVSGSSSKKNNSSTTSSSTSSSNNNPSSPKTGAATPLAGTVVLLLASAAAIVSLGKRKEN